jgi:DNA-binding NarL/FixJ family response regulator
MQEQMVMDYLCEGVRMRRIANELNVCLSTASNYAARARAKYGARSNTEAAIKHAEAMKARLIVDYDQVLGKK